MTGRKLGNYEIVDKLGEGGMGEVWRARDLRLGRFVALKVLPSDVANDPARRQRFEAEARAVGALSHPNIVAVYDVGELDGCAFMVSELVDGESLRALVARGPVASRKLIDLAAQIADGLAAAHLAGIVHRDLKPENVMIARDGRAKILDFGLAKQIMRKSSEETATTAFSEPGTVLGTVGYMSPEQVRGEPVDQRSDIFSFGCILYELASGQRAFQGRSAADVMSAILNVEPPELAAAAGVQLSPALDTIVRRCLEKRPEQRFQSAADLAFALRSISGMSGSHAALAPVERPLKRAKWLRLALAGAAAFALFAAGYFVRLRTSVPSLPSFERLTFRQGQVSSARFTADGQNVLYSAAWDGGPSRIYLVTPGNPESRDLQMPDGARLLGVSAKNDIALLTGPFTPDGAGTLAVSSLAGGQPRPMLEDVIDADWSPDGSALAVGRRVNGKWRIEYPVGNKLAELPFPPSALSISPDGSQVAFADYANGSRIGIALLDSSGKRKFLGTVSGQLSVVLNARLSWRPDGREIWFRSFDARDPGTIEAIGIDGRQRVIAHLPARVNLHDLSRGKILASTTETRRGILGLAPGQTVERELSILDASDLAAISRDGRTILADVRGDSGGPRGSIYLRPTDGSPPVRVGDGQAFAFSPDGKWLSGYVANDEGVRRFLLIPTGPGEQKDVVVPGLVDHTGIVVGWLPGDQNYLVMGARPGARGWQLFSFDAVHGSLHEASPQGVNDGLPLIAPDGRRYLTIGPDHVWTLYSMEGSVLRQIPGLTAHDKPLSWMSDNRSIFISTHADTNKTIRVSIFDLDTTARKPWKEINPTRPVDELSTLVINPDGTAYAYNFLQTTSDLYLIQGFK